MARARGLERPARGALFLCGLSSNILSFGGIATLFLIGPIHAGGQVGAVADLALYRVFETPGYFLLAWPVFYVPVVLVREQSRSWVLGVISVLLLVFQMGNMAAFVNWHWVG